MFLKLIATFVVTLFFGVSNTIKDVPQRILQPKMSSYVYDTTSLEGYYLLDYNDSAFNNIFNVQGDSFVSYNPSDFTAFFFPMLTFMYEGVVSYYPVGAYSNIDDMFIDISSDIYDDYPSLDFFIIDIPYFATINDSLYLQTWIRYYGIGEQKLGSICYFEDNSAFYLWSSDYGTAYCFFDIFNLNNLNNIGGYSPTHGHLIASTESDIYFKRLYTETRPMLLSYSSHVPVSGTPSCLNSETYLYPFHFERRAEGNGVLFDYTDSDSYKVFENGYQLKFGFSHANSSTGYESDYNDGYQVGYDEGSEVADSQLNDKYNEGYSDGYEKGYDDSYDDYYDSRYTQGYNDGRYDESQLSNKYTFANLFGALADTPIMILRSLLGFEVFGTNAMTILMSMVTACIALFVIRKII